MGNHNGIVNVSILFHKVFKILITGLFLVDIMFAQSYTFFAEQTTGTGDAVVEIQIVDPTATTGDDYRVYLTDKNDSLFFSVENLTTQTVLADQVLLGNRSSEFEGITVTVSESEPHYKDLIEVKYGNNPVDPPVHIFRPGDLQGEGGNNSTNEYTFVGGGGDGSYAQIDRGEQTAAPYDYELRFDGDPLNKNRMIFAFTGEGTFFNTPFSLWNIGIGTPEDTTDDYQIIAVGLDDGGISSVYDGGAVPSDGGDGTMFDRIYFFELNRDIASGGDINNDNVVNYDDVLQDIQNNNNDISPTFFSRPYVGNEVIGRFSMVSLNGNSNYLPPTGTTIRITTTKLLSDKDTYTFTTPQFGLYTNETTISFPDRQINQQATSSLMIFNNNSTDAIISNITNDNNSFTPSSNNLTIFPGDSAIVEISFTPTTEGLIHDTLTILSNDPFFPDYKIFLIGEALPQTQGDVNIFSRTDIPGTFTTDVWGYVDTTTGKEYAIVGDASGAGVTIIDVTDPTNPIQVANVNTVPGFDVKVRNHYIYTVNGGGSGEGGIIDISTPEEPKVVGSFPSSHNIFIAENGYMYLECPGLRIYDLNVDPTNPALIWNDGTNGCHDASVIGNRLYDFHGGEGTNIYDVTNPETPQLLTSITDPAISYHHSGWTSEDGNYLLICDELSNHPVADITIWDISDIDNPEKVAEISDSTATVHNLYVIGDYAYVAYYTAGFRVYDISNPAQPILVDEFDTDTSSEGEIFRGAFGVYPFAPSGNIYVSDWDNGLYVFSFAGLTTEINTSPSKKPSQFALYNNYPNPFNPTTTIAYHLPKNSTVKLVIYNTLGQPVRTLVNSFQTTGIHKINWDGRNDAGMQAASGIYFYQIQAENFIETKRLIMLK